MARDEAWMREYQRRLVERAELMARVEADRLRQNEEERRMREAAQRESEDSLRVSNIERLYHNLFAPNGFVGGNNPIPASTVWRTDASTTFNIPEIPAIMTGTGRPSVQRVGVSSSRPRTTSVGEKFAWLT